MLGQFLKYWNPRVETSVEQRQSGALPYSVVDGRVVFLLITSRRTGRWIFPKGAVEPGMTPWESAALEALEEAGVTGEMGTEPIGSYRASASLGASSLVDVDLYPLRVQTQHETWKEMHQRLRHWAVLSEARRLLNDRALSGVAVRLRTQLRAAEQARTRS